MISKNTIFLDEKQNELINILKTRFQNHMYRHEGLDWENVELKLKLNVNKLNIIYEMEITGGEVDVVSYDKQNNEYTFVDCSTESPKGRRSLCYDHKALNSRKENKPKNSVINMAEEIGIEILNEKQYRELQKLDNFDLKTSSWIKTPDSIRELGGALFCDRRYNTVFTYHNGAPSYYSSRGFRGYLAV